MIPDLLNGRIRSARFQKNCHTNYLRVAGLVHQVRNHIVWFSVNVLLTGMMEVKLRKLVGLVSDDQKVPGSRGVMVIHANRVSVVHQIFKRTTSGFEFQGWKDSFYRSSNVDRRLFLAGIAGSVVRI